MNTKQRKFCLKTYGCQMNIHDSERMTGMMGAIGYSYVDDYGDADVVLINTCAVREKPERKLFGELGRLNKIKQTNPDMIIGVTGCMAPRDADVIRARAPYVDLIVGPRSISRLPELVRKVELQRRPIEAIDLFDDPTPITSIRRASNISGWVDIQFGCDYQCTYCAVPSARGAEVSRKPSEIFGEIDELKSLGYKEITLLGQSVNSYGRDVHYVHPEDESSTEKMDFVWLLEQIDKRAGNMRVRFTSPHPQLFNKRFLDRFAEIPTLCEHIHLPIQSANNEVLRRMKRSYTVEKYRETVAQMRERIPEIAITTDIIVAFPGETEQQFQDTLDFYREIEFDQAFMFAYSPRRHTEAFKMKQDEIPKEVAQDRLARLIELANSAARTKNRELEGREFQLLVEGPSPKNADKLSGRTRTNKIGVFEGTPEMIGQFVKVRANEGFLWGFKGTCVD